MLFRLGFGVFVDEDRDDHDDGNDVLAVVWFCLVFRCCQRSVFVVDVVDDVLHPWRAQRHDAATPCALYTRHLRLV